MPAIVSPPVFKSMNDLSPSITKKNRTKFRSSRPEVFCKKGVLENFAKFTEKHLCQSLLKRLRHRCFPVNFAKFLTTPFFYRTPPVAASASLQFTSKFDAYLHSRDIKIVMMPTETATGGVL